MSVEFKEIWETLSKIDVNENAEKKGKFTYLSWSWAWAELMKVYPEATYDFLRDNINADGSMEVRVEITIGEHSRFMWLPVMDYSNKAMTKPDGMAINKARMRCLVKCIAMFGLGLYIYAGEDLPEEGEPEPLKPTAEETATFKMYIENEDALRFYLFTKSLEEEVYIQLYNSAPTAKMKFKAKCDELEKGGLEAAQEIVSTTTDLLDSGDAAWKEELEGLEKAEKGVLWGLFDDGTRTKMREWK